MNLITHEDLDETEWAMKSMAPPSSAVYAPVLLSWCRALLRETDRLRGERDSAFTRGIESMRTAAVDLVKHNSHEDGVGMGSQRIEDALRALVIPEGKS